MTIKEFAKKYDIPTQTVKAAMKGASINKEFSEEIISSEVFHHLMMDILFGLQVLNSYKEMLDRIGRIEGKKYVQTLNPASSNLNTRKKHG